MAVPEWKRLEALSEVDRRGYMGPRQKAAFSELNRRWKKIIEPAATAVTSAIAEPVSGLVGLAAAPWGVDASVNAINKTQQGMTYQPKSEAGLQGLQALQKFMQPVGDAFEGASSYLGDAAYEATGSPALGAAAYSIPTMALEVLGLKGAGKIPGKQLELGDIGRGGVGSKQRGIFAGVKAKTADMDALNKAQEMMAQGASRDEVWNQTGWFKDVDGGWKFEIDDSGARTRDIFKSDPMAREILEEADEVSTDLPYAMSHERFRSAYPDEFADTEVISKPYAQSEGGRYSMGTIKTPTDFRYGDDSFSVNKSTTLHEMQHAIQGREGFARGGSASVAAWADNNARPDLIVEYQRLRKEIQKPASIEKYARDAWGSDDITPEIRSAYNEYVDSVKNTDIAPNIDRDLQATAARNVYQRLAGEAEARNVETRMNMTPDERRAKAPWQTLDVPESELIVRRSGGVAESSAPAGTLKGLTDGWKGRGIDSWASEKGDKITLNKIVVPDGDRGAGMGSAAMQELINYADSNGKRIELTPSSDFGGNKQRLIKFYKRHGFVENKGKNKDYEISESMYRPVN